MYVLDLWRKQSASDEWIEAFCNLVAQWKPVGWAEEKGQISAGVGPAVERRQCERQAYCSRGAIPHKRRQGGQGPIHSWQDGAFQYARCYRSVRARADARTST
jgi:hypothetical protein